MSKTASRFPLFPPALGRGARRRLIVPLVAACIALPGQTRAESPGPVWFSDAPPSAEWAKRSRFAHGGPVERGRGGLYHKRLWYREGTLPQEAAYPADYRSAAPELLVLGPGDASIPAQPFTAGDGRGVYFAMPEEGFYNTYLVSREVRDGRLSTEVAKAEALKHSCGEGHDRRFTEARMTPRRAAGVPFEILRERLPDEDFHTRLASGDPLDFRVLLHGRPAAGAAVSLTTEHGWTRRVTADAEGRARFRLIRDYYPPWQRFDKRESQSFLVTAELQVTEAGSHDGQSYTSARYRTTLPGWYFPSARDYASYAYGLLVMLVAAALAGGGVYLYRLRTARPTRERFDETA